MIGLGKWKFKLDTFLYSGLVYVTIGEEQGSYTFQAEIPGMNPNPRIEIESIRVTRNEIHALYYTDALPWEKPLPADLTFQGDTMTIVLQLPFFGEMTLENGVRVRRR